MGSEEWKALANPNYEAKTETVEGVVKVDEGDTEAAEAEAQKAYEDFMADAKKNVSVKTKKVEMDKEDKIAAEAKLETDIKDLKMTQDELLAAERYYERLVPQCVDA